ncbi:MAG: nucleotidyl transferase AbiEii/AbiGii toxin family protein [Candidatus Nanopusillus sp.]|nr:nucleotidyl transferase AbiEii/AbiGii toxin family protein [Candidatus Nanopusillus sp.]
MSHTISQDISEESYKLTDKPTIRNLESILKAFASDYDIKPILIGGMAVAAYAKYYNEDYNRETKDIDFIINEKYRTKAKEIIYRELPDLSIKEGRIFGYNGIEIKYEYGPSVSILFKDKEVPYNIIELKLGKRVIKLYVAKMEYLLVDKIFTYLRRKEEKDLDDIGILTYLMTKHGYNRELLYKIFDEYSEKYEKYASKAKDILESIIL